MRLSRSAFGSLLFLLPVAIVCHTVGATERVYWTQADGKILRADLNGANQEELLTGLSSPSGIAIDLASGLLYWTERNANTIHRANLDGSDPLLLLATTDTPQVVQLDLRHGKLYWIEQVSIGGPGGIHRADLDGSNPEEVLAIDPAPGGIALDLGRDRLYWTSGGTGRIQRADLDGNDVQDVLTGLAGPIDLALDLSAGKIYWTESGLPYKMRRADLDGSNVEELFDGGDVESPGRLVLDQFGSRIYWTYFAFGPGPPDFLYGLMRFSFTGTNMLQIVDVPISTRGVAVDQPLEAEAPVELQVGRSELSWPAVPGSLGYDVVRGDLPALRLSGGDFAGSTTDCLGQRMSTNNLPFSEAPDEPGAGFWILARTFSVTGKGSYDSDGPGQTPGRDDGTLASGVDCP